MLEPLYSFATLASTGAAVVSVVIVLRQPRVAQNWWLLLALAACASGVVLDSFTHAAVHPADAAYFQAATLIVRSFLPGAWLAFSITFARAPGRPFRRKSLVAIAAAFLVPIAFAVVFRRDLVADVRVDEIGEAWVIMHSTARALHVMVLAGIVVAMMKVEATFRSAVATTRWRLKFAMLGVAVVLGTLIYTRAQSVLFSQQPAHRSALDAIGLFLSSLLMAIAIPRGGFDRQDVISPKMSIGNSITVFVVGSYLFIVGILAQAVVLVGKTANFQIQAFVVLVAIAALAVLLLSDRVRQKLRGTWIQIFNRPVYDFRKVWTQFSRQLSTQHTAQGVCSAAAGLIADTFHLLSVRIWLLPSTGTELRLGASTAPSSDEALAVNPNSILSAGAAFPTGPFNLESAAGELADILRRCSPGQFHNGGARLAIPLLDHEQTIGVAVLADRVNGVPYTPEELNLLECIGAQISANLANLRITQELVQAKELEAFQTMSAFFVHDLKNAVSTLNLMLQNLPVHFANPEFRQDALRGIANTVDRVNHLIARLGALRGKLELRRVPTDLHQIIRHAIETIGPLDNVQLFTQLEGCADILGDPEHLRSVLSNLILNARDAVTGSRDPLIKISTRKGEQMWILDIEDNGVGMTADFLQGSLFRPFSSTKAKGLGIGMFQCKAIIESHKGTIQVQSEIGSGTQIQVTLPAQ